MAENLQIYQYQSVNFTDTSSGEVPLSRSWSFSGGSPATGTGITAAVFYNVPGDYTVSLTETDAYGTTSTLTKSDLVQVSPTTLVAGISGPSPSSVKMNEGYSLQDSTVGTPFPPTAWAWTLPYGRYASTQNVGVTGYADWNTLTGAYTGAPGVSYTANISLAASNAYLSNSASTAVSVQKLGPSEQLYLNATGPSSPNFVTGLSGGIVTNGGIPVGVDFFGYSSSNLIVRLNYLLRGASDKTNLYFHSDTETATVVMYTGLWSSMYNDVIGGFLMVQGQIYSLYSYLTPDDAINLGLYITEGQTSEFFLGDSNGLLLNLYTNYNYSADLLNYLVNNPYKIAHSGNLQYSNAFTFPTPMSFVGTGGGSNFNPVVYSSAYLQNLNLPSFPTPANPVYQIYVSVTMGGIPYGATASIGTIGATGNDPLTSGNPNGGFYTAQDTVNGSGFVSFLNSAINTSIPGGTGSIQFSASPIFSCAWSGTTGSGYSPSDYYGVALLIKNATTVQLVSISDNSSTITGYYSANMPPLTTPIAPFTANYGNSQGSLETCSGLFSTPLSITPGIIYNSMNFGGSIAT
jgi:hypothetical protein